MIPYTIGYSLKDDCLWVELIRTYHPNQYQLAMDELIRIAKTMGKTKLKGEIFGKARLRLFLSRGWKISDFSMFRSTIEISFNFD